MNSDSRDGLGGESRKDQQPSGQRWNSPGSVGSSNQPPSENSAATIRFVPNPPRSRARAQHESATIIILPIIRVEKY